jgi:hypothetical protein
VNHHPHEFDIGPRTYTVTFKRQIAQNQRSVEATAHDDTGVAIMLEQVTTASARAFLHLSLTGEPPTWEELERVAVDLLKLRLDE